MHNFCTLSFWIEQATLLEGIRSANNVTDYRDPAQRAGYYHAYEQAEANLDQRGVRSKGWFEESLQEYLSLTLKRVSGIDQLPSSRAGRHRQASRKAPPQGSSLSPGEHPLVRRFLELRRAAEFPAPVEGAATQLLSPGRRRASPRQLTKVSRPGRRRSQGDFSRIVIPYTPKYRASGCWNTSAETLASGSIMSPSVRWTPISSGRRALKSSRWKARSGQAG